MTDPQQQPAPPVQYVYVTYGPPPVQAVPPAPSTNPLARAGVVLGFVAAALGLVPYFGWLIAVPPALLALIFGIIGLVEAKRLGGLRRSEAICAIILSFLPAPICLAEMVILVALGVITT